MATSGTVNARAGSRPGDIGPEASPAPARFFTALDKAKCSDRRSGCGLCSFSSAALICPVAMLRLRPGSPASAQRQPQPATPQRLTVGRLAAEGGSRSDYQVRLTWLDPFRT